MHLPLSGQWLKSKSMSMQDANAFSAHRIFFVNPYFLNAEYAMTPLRERYMRRAKPPPRNHPEMIRHRIVFHDRALPLCVFAFDKPSRIYEPLTLLCNENVSTHSSCPDTCAPLHHAMFGRGWSARERHDIYRHIRGITQQRA